MDVPQGPPRRGGANDGSNPSGSSQQPVTSTRVETLEDMKAKHDEAYMYVDQGITLEHHGKRDQALAMYQKGLFLIDQALELNVDGPACTGEAWEKARNMAYKMRKTKKEILSRVVDLQIVDSTSNLLPPPSYEEFLNQERQSHHDPYGGLHQALNDVAMTNPAQVPPATPREAEELFCIPDNVQIYFVSADGDVSAPSYPSSLRICRFKDAAAATNQPPAFLQVGDWTYPILPGQFPILQSEYGAYMLPDLTSHVPGAAVGVLLPANTSPETHELFQDILAGLSQQPVVKPGEVRPEGAPGAETVPRKISRGIIQGAEYLSKGVVMGAEKAGGLLDYGTPKLVQRITPESAPRQIDPRVQQGMKIARDVTGTAVRVSGYVVSKVGWATMALGRYLAPHVQKYGTRLVSSASGTDETTASHAVDNVLEVAAGAVQGFGTIYMGLENAAKVLGKSVAQNTVTVINHKYGTPAGQVADDTVYTVGNVVMAGYNVNSLGVKGIAKKAAKDTGKALVENYGEGSQAIKPANGEKSDVDNIPPKPNS